MRLCSKPISLAGTTPSLTKKWAVEKSRGQLQRSPEVLKVLDGPIHANRLRVQTAPPSLRIAFQGTKNPNRRFEAICANRSNWVFLPFRANRFARIAPIRVAKSVSPQNLVYPLEKGHKMRKNSRKSSQNYCFSGFSLKLT